MRLFFAALALLLLGLPARMEGGAAMPVDAFIERAGIEADAVLRDNIAAFLDENGYSAHIIEAMSPELLRRYAAQLSAGLPISYEGLLTEPAIPLPDGPIRELMVLHPEGAATASLVVDFERGWLYYDEARNVAVDVCRAGVAVPLTDETSSALRRIIESANLQDWAYDYPGDPMKGVNVLALRCDVGVVRYTAAALSDAPDIVLDTLLDLLSVAPEPEVK